MRSPEWSPSTKVRVHRALASSVRTSMLEVLQSEPDLDTASLADRLNLHVNTVRTHLNVLEEAGLVVPVAEERDRPGRPRLLYRAVEQVGASSQEDDGNYRLLAAVLASYIEATNVDAAAAAVRAGEEWGSFVVDKPPPFRGLTSTAAIERLVAMLDKLGFAPKLDDSNPAEPQLLLRRCPFLDVARDHQDVVCSVHLGLMRGALAELGVDIEAKNLIPWAEPNACIAHLKVGAS